MAERVSVCLTNARFASVVQPVATGGQVSLVEHRQEEVPNDVRPDAAIEVPVKGECSY